MVKINPVHVTIKSSLDETRGHPYGQKNQMPPVNCSAALEREYRGGEFKRRFPRDHDGENEPVN